MVHEEQSATDQGAIDQERIDICVQALDSFVDNLTEQVLLGAPMNLALKFLDTFALGIYAALNDAERTVIISAIDERVAVLR